MDTDSKTHHCLHHSSHLYGSFHGTTIYQLFKGLLHSLGGWNVFRWYIWLYYLFGGQKGGAPHRRSPYAHTHMHAHEAMITTGCGSGQMSLHAAFWVSCTPSALLVESSHTITSKCKAAFEQIPLLFLFHKLFFGFWNDEPVWLKPDALISLVNHKLP